MCELNVRAQTRRWGGGDEVRRGTLVKATNSAQPGKTGYVTGVGRTHVQMMWTRQLHTRESFNKRRIYAGVVKQARSKHKTVWDQWEETKFRKYWEMLERTGWNMKQPEGLTKTKGGAHGLKYWDYNRWNGRLSKPTGREHREEI